MLTLPPKFKQALGNGVRTSLYPLVRIYKGVQIDDPIPEEASINLSIKETNIGGEAYNPLLLNSPSISSKADIINNKYTISSVSLSISNAPYKGKIFSDDIPNLLNAVVQVYYAANGLDSLEDCLLVYTGTIRRYSQSAESLSLTLEDLTEQKLKTQIPSTLIEDEDDFTEDNIGQPYPIVYGYVDKSPLVLNKFDNLIIDKPQTEVGGIWENVSNIDLQNTSINNQHPLRIQGFLKLKSFLYAYDSGYIPVMKEIPKNFGSRNYPINDISMYEFENSTTNTSSKIILNSLNFIYDKYTLDSDTDEIVGQGQTGIPTRIYRPVKKVTFFAKHLRSFFNSGLEDYTYVGAAVKFYGFSNTSNYDMQKHVRYRMQGSNTNDWQWFDNIDSNADNDYEEGWESGNWWQPTELNIQSGTDNNDGIFANIDTNYPIENQNFPVQWIQNNNNTSGLFIDAQVLQERDGGGYASLQLDENIGNFPCVTKIFYNIDYFTPTNIGEGSGGRVEGEPSAFWVERNLINRKANDCNTFDEVKTKNAWQTNYDTEDWTTACEVPNDTHNFVADSDNHRYTTTGLNGEGYDNINLGFGSTNSHNSIQWGIPQMYKGVFGYASSCIANLKQFYTIQDVLVNDYVNRNFYANIKGRIDNNENVISKSHTILQDILDKELAYGKQVILPDETIQDDWINSFSMNEQSEAKSVIESLFKSSIYIPSFDSNGNFKFIDLKQNIEDYDQFETIDNLDIIKYSFSLTKLEDIKNQVNVKYKKDYGLNELTETTGYGIEDNNGNFVNTLDELTEELTPDMVYDIGYYSMTDADAKLEVETEYIRDKDTARKLQRRLLMWYANQHLTMKLDLPPSYIYLEAGDYIRFDELIGGKLAFGFDYTQEFVKNGQLIYPVFFVTKVAKSLSKVSLELVQVHRGDFGMSDDDLGSYKVPNPYELDIYQDEVIEEEDTYFTFDWYLNNDNLNSGLIWAITNTNLETDIEYEVLLVQSNAPFGHDGQMIEPDNLPIDASNLVNASLLETESLFGDDVQITPKLNDSNIVTPAQDLFLKFKLIIKADDYDISISRTFDQHITDWNFLPGDVNEDGIVNVLDIVATVQLTLGDIYNPNADMNGDGGINILDIVIIINLILGN